MRLHADTLTYDSFRAAKDSTNRVIGRAPGVAFSVMDHGSRSRRAAWELTLTGSSTRRPNSGRYGAGDETARAATWDEWGVSLSALFLADDTLTIPRVYESAEHFHWSTGSRFDFRDLRSLARHSCRQHKWFRSDVITGAYSVLECRNWACDAISRQMTYGRTFESLAL